MKNTQFEEKSMKSLSNSECTDSEENSREINERETREEIRAKYQHRFQTLTNEYFKNCQRFEAASKNTVEIKEIEKFFITNKVKCIKYSYNFNIKRDHQCHNAFLQLTPDCKQLLIIKKNVVPNFVPASEDPEMFSSRLV